MEESGDNEVTAKEQAVDTTEVEAIENDVVTVKEQAVDTIEVEVIENDVITTKEPAVDRIEVDKPEKFKDIPDRVVVEMEDSTFYCNMCKIF